MGCWLGAHGIVGICTYYHKGTIDTTSDFSTLGASPLPYNNLIPHVFNPLNKKTIKSYIFEKFEFQSNKRIILEYTIVNTSAFFQSECVPVNIFPLNVPTKYIL